MGKFLIFLGLPVRPLIFLKKQKISLEELYGYASSDEESTHEDDGEPNAQNNVPIPDHVDAMPLCDEVPADEAIPAGEGNIMRFFKSQYNIVTMKYHRKRNK